MKTTTFLKLTTALSLAVLMPAPSTQAAPLKKKGIESKAESALTATLTISPSELSPESTIEVVFPTPMIEKERIGTIDADPPLIITPPIPGEFQWVSTRSGQYKLSQAPKFNATYDIALKPKTKDLGGKPLSTESLATAQSAAFQILDHSPRWFSRNITERSPKILFEFNDNVHAAAVAEHFIFVSSNPPLTVPAKARHATGKDFSRYSQPQATWDEQIAKVKPTLAPEATRLSAISLEPQAPLPVAEKWKLVVKPSLTNASGYATLAAGQDIEIGDVKPFEVRQMTAHTPFDESYYINISFNRSLRSYKEAALTKEQSQAFADKIAESVHIEPHVEGLKVQASDSNLRIEGPFALKTAYRVVVEPNILSGDGLKLAAVKDAELTFVANPPYVATPAFVRTQLSKGHGDFEIAVANVREVRVRAKRLSGQDLLQTIEKYTAYQNHFNRYDKDKKPFTPDSIHTYPGSVVFERTFQVNKPLDKSDMIKLNWKEVLGNDVTAPLFIEFEGLPAEGIDQKATLTQSLIQFTNIGLMQKSNGRETLIFVTSLQTGKPLSGVRLTTVDKELKPLATAESDKDGVALLKGDDPYLILAENAGDITAITCSNSHINGAVPYDIPTAWQDVWKPVRRTFIFSDRPLYRPGDTAHFKALNRLRSADDLTLDPEGKPGRLVIRDPRYRIILEKEISFSANGSWSEDIKLPEGPSGWYEMTLHFTKENDDNEGASGFYSFRIDDYKPNSFEVHLDGKKLEVLTDRLKLPISANYYMGKSLSKAKASWNASSTRSFTPPSAFNEFHFGEAPRWANYGKDRDADGTYDDSDSEDESEWWVNGDVSLADDGTATLEMPMPPPNRAALPQQVRVSAEITDINQQTISAATEFEIPGADYLLGLKGPQFFGTAGNETNVEVIAIDSKGNPATGNIHVEVKVERQEYHTLKIATAGGGSTTKDQVILREELKQNLDLKPQTSGSPPASHITFKPSRGGVYFVTVESSDPQGKKLLSRLPIYVVGNGEFPWAMEDGNRINLQPEKKKLKAGEEAVIVVKTPIAGTALVSVERNKIHRHFVTEISPEKPIIKVPVQDDEAPNVFVSVILIRGSDASPAKDKMPVYKVGYCQLEVESKAKELAIEIASEKPEVKPGESFKVNGVITDYKGAPVSSSEVTLYAVDEGVLSLMKHKTPDPSAYFHEQQPLAIHNFTTFDDILPEEFAARERGNKGFVIGGGGEMDESAIPARKNFVATPLWLATVMTDASGKISATVKAPDNLTRYRLMAIATSGADRFGKGESAVKINKPLMVEPVVPRFARLEDETLLKAVIHNTTPHSGEVMVRLELDETTDFIRDRRDFIPASIKPAESTDPKVWQQTVSIKAGETTSVAFPVRFTKLGTANWRWVAKTSVWTEGAPTLDDATETTFEVTHPVPELKEVHYVRLNGGDPEVNLIKKVNPALLEGDGSVQISISTSRLSEAKDALSYILTYPYGCAEQTTSSTMPWLALGGYHTLFPDLITPDKTKESIQQGVDRLMRMVTDGGGLAYWPGGDSPSLFASAYGGLMLLRAKDAGANIPPEMLDRLTEYLSKELRGLGDAEKNNYRFTDCALALYTLAKAQKAEPAYQTMLHARRDELPEVARLYTALSMCLTNTPSEQIKEMIGWTAPAKDGKAPSGKKKSQNSNWTHWTGNDVNKALRLIVYTHLGLTQDAETLAQDILKNRNGRGEWGNTFTNAWTLTSLVAYERSLKSTSLPLVADVQWDSQKQPLNIPTPPGVAQVAFVLNQQLAAAPLKVNLPTDREAFSRLQASAYPPIREIKGENKGYAIERTYQKLLDDGRMEPAENLRVGDMVVITLNIEIGGEDRYLAIDDSLPSVLEAINPEFDTQSEREGNQLPEGVEAWFCDHREVRADRALFFTDYAPNKGKFQLRYLARVSGEGDVIAPPCRIEAMYEPDKYGLSSSQRLRTLPSASGQVTQK